MQTSVSTYADVVRAHACRAAVLYKDRWCELERLCGFRIAPDGTNGAASAQDVERYLKAVETVGGAVAVVSARLVLKKAAAEAGLRLTF